ncbi:MULTISPECIES: MFS transporter [unclassified Streptomyces]|uniref:MFS transporter n=1 Tax=unclassified Streptomyces TaxID=2593676 RepID=UPI00068D31E2|nr:MULTISPECIES: MFS transporter [unclassified Streptomyces]MCH0559039.1 MFS transporter [Streptomyces sp. MUM 16J]
METKNAAGTSPSRKWGVLGQRDFRLLWIGETARGIGNSVTAVAVPLVAVVTLDTSATAVGVLTAAVWLPWLLIGLPAGAWADRMRRRPLLMACAVVSAILYATVPVAAWLDVLTFTHLLTVVLVCGIAAVFVRTAVHSYLPTVLTDADLQEGNARISASESATDVVGKGLAGLISQVLGAVTGLLLDAVTFILSALCLAGIKAKETEPERPDQSVPLGRQITEGLRFVFGDRYLRPIVTYGALVNFALLGYQAVQVVFLVRTVGANTATVGVLLTAGSIGGIVGASAAPAIGRRFGTARGMLAAQLLTGPFALLLPLTASGAGLAFFAVGTFVLGFGIVTCNVVLASFRQTYCPPRILGRVVATTMVINHSTIPVGALIGGFLGDAVGPRPAMWIMTAVLAPCGLVLALGPMRSQRDLPATVRPEPSPDTHEKEPA